MASPAHVAASRGRHRRRRLCRPRAGDRAASGPGRSVCGDGHRSRAGACPVERPSRFGNRRRGAAPVRSDRGLGCGRGGCAADPRHGRDRFKARRRGAAHISCLRRRCGRGRAIRAHDREPAPRGRAGRKRRRNSASIFAPARLRVSKPARIQSTLRWAMADRYPRAFWSVPTARIR